MDFTEILAAAGLRILNGHARLNAALNAGIEVQVVDEFGTVFSINRNENQLYIQEQEGVSPRGDMIMISKQVARTLH